MPEVTTLKITGGKELEEKLRTFGPKFTNRWGLKSLKAGAATIVADAKQRVPVLTGELRDSITAVAARTKEQAQKKVKIGFKYPAARRAHFTEFGTVYQPAQPFLRPALDSQAQAAVDQITEVLRDAINDDSSLYANVPSALDTLMRLGEEFAEEIG